MVCLAEDEAGDEHSRGASSRGRRACPEKSMASLTGKSERMRTAESAIDTDGKEQVVPIAQSIELAQEVVN